uniref:Uncharacterized protein n=1 Tax=Cacopsylla melanoneura TaxID=428564 RepID=A0A8D9BWD2_9HEMI
MIPSPSICVLTNFVIHDVNILYIVCRHVIGRYLDGSGDMFPLGNRYEVPSVRKAGISSGFIRNLLMKYNIFPCRLVSFLYQKFWMLSLPGHFQLCVLLRTSVRIKRVTSESSIGPILVLSSSSLVSHQAFALNSFLPDHNSDQ